MVLLAEAEARAYGCSPLPVGRRASRFEQAYPYTLLSALQEFRSFSSIGFAIGASILFARVLAWNVREHFQYVRENRNPLISKAYGLRRLLEKAAPEVYSFLPQT